ncbi:MAG: hypothetical protein UT66_C0004G0029 [candidate division CPR2 bacterium GW2011_GWC1_39_9]|uniref:Uncharacterized protein n=1 Tax=candidate division CPR2 bacterium GW2011_GWC2_39_10 TaxID=1618345 RepID=A0A0G0LV66_UNCC2|nr:MAG: hypothetical protein UT18_C0006G0020 [candidate division CPR2 bacterium GW2011_GWC2_39_10]KKR36034.1 MAG: hypothetical protein UT66_C0004G0029 [candidate division CPR2 bacterium GW2011_GWC1_39_9]
MNLNIIKNYNDLAVNTYHVNPKVFIFLMILSVPFYYWGWLAIGTEIVRFKKRYYVEKKGKISDIFFEKKFSRALVINRIAWAAPYIYVILFGSNIPLWFWFLFFGWIIFGSYLFSLRLKKMIVK